MRKRFVILALAMIGAEGLAAAAVAGPAIPTSPMSVEPAAAVQPVDLVCDFNGCYETWDRPPPGYRRPPPPPPRYRPPPVYVEPGYRPPPPPPGYHRPPPPYYDEEPGYRPPRGNWRRHVDWCLDRYRSYNPRTNQFLSSSGYWRTCRSPFG